MISSNIPPNPAPLKEIQEMAIAISASSFNPNLINLDFLKFSGIIPTDWELSRQPISNPNMIQLFFQNRVSIAAQPNMVTFIENIGTGEFTDLLITDVAKQFTQKLPNADYQTVSFSPKSVIPFKGGADAGRRYITRTLLAPGAWQEIGKAPMQANLNLLYELDRCQLSLAINEANIQMPDQSSVPAVLFSASFNYAVANFEQSERLHQIHKGIEHWDLDLSVFRELIEQRFLTSNNTLFPTSFPMS